MVNVSLNYIRNLGEFHGMPSFPPSPPGLVYYSSNEYMPSIDATARNCGMTTRPGNSQLSAFIENSLEKVKVNDNPLCVMEVGTADGSGTTVALHHALHSQCSRVGGRSFTITTYEGLPQLARDAKELWKDQASVTVVNELVITDNNIDKYVIPVIEGPEGGEFPGTGFYKKLYGATRDNVNRGELGGFFKTKPMCGVMDIVLIDSTRYAHAGIIATLLSSQSDNGQHLIQPDTVFILENDFWPGSHSSDGNERRILERYWILRNVTEEHPIGEQWPWISFKIKHKQ